MCKCICTLLQYSKHLTVAKLNSFTLSFSNAIYDTYEWTMWNTVFICCWCTRKKNSVYYSIIYVLYCVAVAWNFWYEITPYIYMFKCRFNWKLIEVCFALKHKSAFHLWYLTICNKFSGKYGLMIGCLVTKKMRFACVRSFTCGHSSARDS